MQGLLKYNYLKVDKKEAKLIGYQGFPKNIELNSKVVMNRFKRTFEKNPRTKTNVVHVSLNFSPKDNINEELMVKIANRYMQEIGFGQQPYLIFRHQDTRHPHMHIISTNISSAGKRIETHNIGRILSEKARKKLETEFRLIKAEEQGKQLFPSKPLEKAEYGISETKAIITNIVTDVMRTYQYASIGEFRAAIAQYNIGMQLRSMRAKDSFPGIIYFVTDNKGNQKSTAVFASKIFSNPTYKTLSKRANRNRQKKETFKKNLRSLIYLKLNEVDSKKDWKSSLQDLLKKEGVYMHFAKNENGKSFGLSFVDNKTRSVFKASDLGKDLTHSALIKRFEGSGQMDLNFNMSKQEDANPRLVSYLPSIPQRCIQQPDFFQTLLVNRISELEWIVRATPSFQDDRGAIGRRQKSRKKKKRHIG